MTNVPDSLRYTAEHEWVEKIDAEHVRVGITAFAAEQLGDVVFVQSPSVDDEVTPGESFAEVESTKSVSDIYGPLSGTVTEVNNALDDAPDLVNSEPYGQGWLAVIRVSGDVDAELAQMLDAAAYQALIAE
ncbi:glycine cleavage system protein GcvH [Gordonia sp. TBRC 11910]|uniref:Glycine cleavage system H protein n=1 Tax=Gordonia asplenii TaxID=2725283 RepID=A0A848KQI7_9ACTN|nr:glycine cleavage system protein GcvH [Gordonia asplenii]NMO00309.1 glycine cleavage system protein GcvH [Gordonia asplenii]